MMGNAGIGCSSVFIFLAFIMNCVFSVGSLTPPDVITLLKFRSSVSDPFGHLSDWKNDNSSDDPSLWTGVTYNSSAQVVVGLLLPSMNLSGSVPSIIGDLHSLKELNLADNNFSGPIPDAIFQPNLLTLNLSVNWLDGAIPRRFRFTPALKILDLNTNCLIGGIPEDLANSSKLQILNLGGNSLGGTIPLQIGSLTELLNFTAHANQLEGGIPASLANLRKLEWLYLGWNLLNGTIPPSFGLLSSLLLIDLCGNSLTGSIPPELGNITTLKLLRLYSNQLVGQIPPHLGNLTYLEALDLALNQLSGGIPGELSQLYALELLHLNSNNLTGDFPSWLSDLPMLNDVYLYSNALTGEMPLGLGAKAPLEQLDVSENQLTGSIPPTLCSKGLLRRLCLFSNLLTGAIPPGILNCPSLVRLRLENNRLNGSFPSILANTAPISLLYFVVANNTLEGGLPAELAWATSLQALVVCNNRLTGPIPLELGRLSELQTVDLSGNVFQGGFPLHICSNKRLYNMQMNGNMFSGPIPSGIASCATLQTLFVAHNQFNGTIPIEIGQLPSLGYLDLSDNQFSGQIPASLADSCSLLSINISNNQLSGSLPTTGAFSNLNNSSYTGNSNLCLGACDGTLSSTITARQSAEKEKRLSILAWALPTVCLLLMLFVFLGFIILYWRCARICKILEQHITDSRQSGCQITTFQKNVAITEEDILSCLREDNVIGRGGAGIVYRGITNKGQPFVVKKLWTRVTDPSHSASSGMVLDHGFQAEMATLAQIRHKNIVRLLCSCSTRESDMLVYEYVPCGSLAGFLGDECKASTRLSWDARYNIAVGVAQGLAYLHHDCNPQILHRDVKSNNILLDADLKPRLSDFGLARFLNRPMETMSVIAGSYGYIAPEYAYTMKVSEKCDVYSFGVVILELVSGRKPVDVEWGTGMGIVEWVTKKYVALSANADLGDLLDQRMLGRISEQVIAEAGWFLKVGLLCTNTTAENRPTMRQVVDMLLQPRIGKSSSSAAILIQRIIAQNDDDDEQV